jgi:membrane-associated protease RseP (regulator of RpoE activity)
MDPNPPYDGPEPEIPHVLVFHPPPRPWLMHISLFLLTVLTTLIVGARMTANFEIGMPYFMSDDHYFSLAWLLHNPSAIWKGVPFSVTLLGILMAHEMGHFIFAMRNRVYATLPFFLPAPTQFGTLGAFIQIKSRFPSRKALFDVGIAGPIAGFAVAVPAAIVGLFLSRPIPSAIDPAYFQIGQPLIFRLLHMLTDLGAQQPPLNSLMLHPIAIAAWIGMLATALNLVPGGQLDGGHIVYALNPRAHPMVTRLVIVVLVLMAYFFYAGWLVWAIGVFITRKHPYVAEWPELGTERRYWFVFALIMLVLTMVAAPLPGTGIHDFIPWPR